VLGGPSLTRRPTRSPFAQAARNYEKETGRELVADTPPRPIRPITVGALTFTHRADYQTGDGGLVTFLQDQGGEVYLGAD
jgi:hypothetical protein